MNNPPWSISFAELFEHGDVYAHDIPVHGPFTSLEVLAIRVDDRRYHNWGYMILTGEVFIPRRKFADCYVGYEANYHRQIPGRPHFKPDRVMAALAARGGA